MTGPVRSAAALRKAKVKYNRQRVELNIQFRSSFSLSVTVTLFQIPRNEE